jgi:hypothetical protein
MYFAVISYFVAVSAASLAGALMVSAFQAYVVIRFGAKGEALPLFVMAALSFSVFWVCSALLAWPAVALSHLSASRWHIKSRLFFPCCGAVLGALACALPQLVPELAFSGGPDPSALSQYFDRLPLFVLPGLLGGVAYGWALARWPNPSIERTS